MLFQNIPFKKNSEVNGEVVYHHIQSNTPLVISNFAKRWKASEWTPEYLKTQIKDIKVPLYNNTKSDAYTPVNAADAYASFEEYIDKILHHPQHQWRLFLFNIYTNAPHLLKDFDYPTDLLSPIVKQAPMLFIGGKGSVTHMHFDIDFSTVLHVQLYGRKRFLLLPFNQQYNIYRKPFEVLSWVDFSNYTDRLEKIESEFPKVKDAIAYSFTLNPGDALIMPPGYWHHIEYLDNSIAISMRSINKSIRGIMMGLWFLTGMRWIDTFMKKQFPVYWNNWKVQHTPYFTVNLKRKFLINSSSRSSLFPM
ncbi:MAG: transcriptional regulator [Bacteroidetes bacterium]|nr:MAG: transcriptional regulator [Bacteroidota bacterium]